MGQHTKNRLQGISDLNNIEKCPLDLDLCYQLKSIEFPTSNCRVELSISKLLSIRDSYAIESLEFKNAIKLRQYAMDLIDSKVKINENSLTLLTINIVANNKRKAPDDEFTLNDEYTPCSIEFRVVQDSLFLGARYNKLVRTISQTPFFIKGERKGENSISEIIGDYFMKLTKSNAFNMVSSGREDLDVRCLGRGRPFMLELKDPKFIDFDWNQHQHSFNAKNVNLVQLQYLKAVAKADANIIKSGEETKSKYYECEVVFDVQLTDDDIVALNRVSLPITVQQKTPMRVVHRRANLLREKTIYDFKLKDNKLYLKTSAGMYIKEFVHGDFGRTTPSLRMLIQDYCQKSVWCDINNLDIVNVELEWPPK